MKNRQATSKNYILTFTFILIITSNLKGEANQSDSEWDKYFSSLTPTERLLEVQLILSSDSNAYRRIKALEKIYDDAVALGQSQQAIEILERAIGGSEDPEIKGRAQYELGKVHRAEGRYDEARHWFMQTLKTTTNQRDLSNARYQLAEDDWQAGNYAESLDEFLEWLGYNSNAELQKLDYFALFECINRCLQKFEESIGQQAFSKFDDLAEKWISEPNVSKPPLQLAKAIRYRVAQEFEAAIQAAAEVRDGEDKYWGVCASLVEVSIFLRQGETSKAVAILDSRNTTGQFDKEITQYLAIDSAYLIYDGMPEASVAATEWWKRTEIYRDATRRNAVRWPQLLTNYAIALQYERRIDDSLSTLKEVLTYPYLGSKWRQFACIILAQHYIANSNLDQAREILESVYKNRTSDEVRAGVADALASLRLSEGDVGGVIDQISTIFAYPDRPGSDGPGSSRFKNRANRILDKLEAENLD